jgi:hypothetical protein
VRYVPEVAQILGHAKLSVEPFEAKLKGFDDDEFQLWRVSRS